MSLLAAASLRSPSPSPSPLLETDPTQDEYLRDTFMRFVDTVGEYKVGLKQVYVDSELFVVPKEGLAKIVSIPLQPIGASKVRWNAIAPDVTTSTPIPVLRPGTIIHTPHGDPACWCGTEIQCDGLAVGDRLYIAVMGQLKGPTYLLRLEPRSLELASITVNDAQTRVQALSYAAAADRIVTTMRDGSSRTSPAT